MAVRILVTGGTFDKEYDELTGKLFFKDTHISDILKLGKCTVDVSIRTLMMIDSLDMTEEDRESIYRHCKQSEEDQIIITHGTDTMAITAKLLARASLPKTIILTGALIPYKFGSSDGLFNLGSALAFAQSLPHGVYIAMNGRYFHAGRVKKNPKTGIFEEL